MARPVKKHNPGFLTDEELIATFCVRVPEYESILESLHTWTENSSPHTLVIGPRGSGKTHLLLRTVAEIRRELALRTIFPILFAEESYEISSCGEFWLEALERLAEQAPDPEQDGLRLSYEEIRSTQDDRTLALRSLGVLLDFADGHQQRLLLVVENLNMLFGDMADAEVGWQLRHTLQTEPRILLLGSATSRFAEIDCPDRALYDLFRVIALHPLDTKDCRVLWQAVCRHTTAQRAIRPLEILTGGNLRLLTIMSHFDSGRSFRELMGNLVDLVDDHTVYFKSHLETLPPRERRVYLALARLWKPATTKEIADLARLDTSKCSALLKRLVGRGVVEGTGGTPRRRQYYLTERLYNIYYLMRRSRGADQMVKALIDFMICLYTPRELGEILEEIARSSHDMEVLSPDTAVQMARAMIEEAEVLESRSQFDEAVAVYDQVVQSLSWDTAGASQFHVACALLFKISVLDRQGQKAQCVDTCEELERRFGTSTRASVVLLRALASCGKGHILGTLHRIDEALEAFDHTLAILLAHQIPEGDGIEAMTIYAKGLALLEDRQASAAIETFDQVLQSYAQSEDPQVNCYTAQSLIWKAIALFETNRYASEDAFALLLQYLAKQNENIPLLDLMTMMSQLVTQVSPARILELIYDSPAAPLLLPLVVALQQMLGLEPRVPKEVEEIAKDVRTYLTHPVRLFEEGLSVYEHSQST